MDPKNHDDSLKEDVSEFPQTPEHLFPPEPKITPEQAHEDLLRIAEAMKKLRQESGEPEAEEET